MCTLPRVGNGAGGWTRARRSSTRARTRDTIVETALRLFAEHGYVGVRVEDIARASGVSRATFYKHFSERDDILAELLGRLLGAGEAIEPDGDGPRERVLSLLTQIAQRMRGDEVLARFIYSLPVRHDAVLPGGPVAPSAIAQVQTEIESGVDAGDLRSDVPVDAVVEAVGRLFEAAMRDWAEGRIDDPAVRLGQFAAIVFDGITND